MYERHELGKSGEDIATEYLRKNCKCQIIKRNFECKQGEIDIIAIDKNELVFVEVKTRSNCNYGKPVDAVNYQKINHFWKTVEYYIYINNLYNEYIRLDIIEVYKKDNKFYIHHIKNAIQG